MLGDELLAAPLDARWAAGRVWRFRERIEREAAQLFDQLGNGFDDAGHGSLAALARRAAADERDHALRCRALVEQFAPGLPALPVPICHALGPAGLSPPQRLLYASVAIGCVTESMSCALLLVMRERAAHPLARATIQHILRDEIRHSRLGWAHLAAEAERGDVTWLARYIPGMLRAARVSEIEPMSAGSQASPDLGSLGILARADADAVWTETLASVIRPGLARYGIRIGPSTHG